MNPLATEQAKGFAVGTAVIISMLSYLGYLPLLIQTRCCKSTRQRITHIMEKHIRSMKFRKCSVSKSGKSEGQSAS